MGESPLSPKAAWDDACFNLPQEFLDSFNLEFSETGIYYTKEETHDRSNQEENKTRSQHEAFGHPESGASCQPLPVVLGTGNRSILLRS